MDREDCCLLMQKIRLEIFQNTFLDKIDKKLTKSFKAKKKSKLFGNKKNEEIIYTSTDANYKGIKLHIVKPEKVGFIVIYNISPIDAPYVQYMWIDYDKHPFIITQHLLDRYKKRILNNTTKTYKELIIDFALKSISRYGDYMAFDSDSKQIIQRIDEGFIFGVEHKHYTVFNTIYESIEKKDNDLKSHSRELNLNWENLNSSQKSEYGKLHTLLESGQITEEEFSKQLFLKKLNVYKNEKGIP